MKILSPFFRPAGPAARRKAVALVVTLAAVVLLTVLVVAFFSRAMLNRQVAFTSTNMVRTDLMARAATEMIVGEIRQEILDGSTPETVAGVSLYPPNTPQDAVLRKVGVTSPDNDVGKYVIAKVSTDNTPLRLSGAPLASGVSLGSTSGNGRTSGNWFSSGPQLGTATLPDWVYLGRTGVVVNPPVADAKDRTKGDYVIGRFAYTVYDTGGLLDANVAGAPSNSTSAPYKGSQAYADLTAIGMDATQVDGLVSWRNSLTGTDAKSFDEWAVGLADSGTSPNVNAARSGHIYSVAGDNSFLSRWDLLKYAGAKGITGPGSYLTHFSRGVTTPAWGPGTNAGGAYNYKDDADLATSINRDFTGVRNTGSNTSSLAHYNDNGTLQASPLEVVPGQQWVQRRFSLAKLAWLGLDGPDGSRFDPSLGTPAQEAAIQACFGLRWNSGRLRWDYVGAMGSSPQTSIKTLSEVVAENREPNFFELLKSGILGGSLGKDPGMLAGRDPATNPSGGPLLSFVGGKFAGNLAGSAKTNGPEGINFESTSTVRDLQILQIGANIIDQQDSGNFPTAIYLNCDLAGWTPSPLDYSSEEIDMFHTVYGVENLPYLAKLGQINSSPGGASASPPPLGAPVSQAMRQMHCWLQPFLWNPHQDPGSTTGRHAIPAHFRVRALGEAITWNVFGNSAIEAASNPVDYNSGAGLLGTIAFDIPSDKWGNLYDFPAGLLLPSDPNSNFSNISTDSRNLWENSLGHAERSTPTRFVGFWSGEVAYQAWATNAAGTALEDVYNLSTNSGSRAVPNPDGITDPTGSQIHTRPNFHLTVLLEYQDSSNQWRPYSVMARIAITQALNYSRLNNLGRTIPKTITLNTDPRTDRFSSGGVDTGAGRPPGPNDSFMPGSGIVLEKHLECAYPRPTSGFTYLPAAVITSPDNGLPVGKGWAINSSGTAGNGNYYADPDGVIRVGDAIRANFASGEGIMLYSSDSATRSHGRRPAILNRPFRSAAELGHVFRDLPFKSLNFWSSDSADAALLDLFSIADQPALVAGTLNLNNAPDKVLQAVISGAVKNESADTPLNVSGSACAQVAWSVATSVAAKPILNPAEIATQLGDVIYSSLGDADALSATDRANKTYGEAPARALSSVASLRTWNLLVDVVAQSGQIMNNATDLGDFAVQGEKRYWLHLAVDRYTGKVVGRQLEPVYE